MEQGLPVRKDDEERFAAQVKISPFPFCFLREWVKPQLRLESLGSQKRELIMDSSPGELEADRVNGKHGTQ